MKTASFHIAPNTLNAAAKRLKTHWLGFTTAVLFTSLSAAAPATLQAQHIGFGLSFGDGIELYNLGSSSSTDNRLDFNSAITPPVLVPGNEKVTISKTENNEGVVIIAIHAPARADVTITVTAPAGNELTLDEENGSGNNAAPPIPFQIGWAYWNNHITGATEQPNITTSDFSAAREVVSALGSSIPFTSATFPITRRAGTLDNSNGGSGGPPLPPPDPNYADRPAVEMATAYVLVYGSLGPVPENAQTGEYSGEIHIHAEITDYGGTEL